MFWVFGRKRRYHEDLMDALEGIQDEIESLKTKQVEMQTILQKFEKHTETNQKRVSTLDTQLHQKIAFIEKLFAGIIDKAMSNGHDANGNGKTDNNIVDISKLSETTKSFILSKIKTEAAKK